MSTHNIWFHGEIRKIFMLILISSRALVECNIYPECFVVVSFDFMYK